MREMRLHQIFGALGNTNRRNRRNKRNLRNNRNRNNWEIPNIYSMSDNESDSDSSIKSYSRSNKDFKGHCPTAITTIIEMIKKENFVEEIENKLPIFEKIYNDNCNLNLHDDVKFIKELINEDIHKDIIEIFLKNFNDKKNLKHFLNDATDNSTFTIGFYLDLLERKKFDILEVLIHYGYNISKSYKYRKNIKNYPNSGPITLLHYCTYIDDSEAIDFLVKHNINKDSIDANGDTALSLACKYDKPDLIPKLISKTNINIINRQKNLPIMVAIKKNNIKCMNMLLSQDEYDVNTIHINNKTLMDMMIDCKIDNEAIFTTLFKKGAYISNKYLKDKSLIPLLENNDGIISTIQKVGVLTGNGNGHIIKHLYPVIYFTKINKNGMIKKLLEKDESLINLKDEKGYTPLFYAIKNGNYGLIEKLVNKYNADTGIMSTTGQTPLGFAISQKNKNTKIIEFLKNKSKNNKNSKTTSSSTNNNSINNNQQNGDKKISHIEKGIELNFEEKDINLSELY